MTTLVPPWRTHIAACERIRNSIADAEEGADPPSQPLRSSTWIQFAWLDLNGVVDLRAQKATFVTIL